MAHSIDPPIAPIPPNIGPPKTPPMTPPTIAPKPQIPKNSKIFNLSPHVYVI